MKSPSNLNQTGKKGRAKQPGLVDAASSVGTARGSASLSRGKGLYPTGAGGRQNNMVAANAALKRYSGRGR
jgi:hypothetical protein